MFRQVFLVISFLCSNAFCATPDSIQCAQTQKSQIVDKILQGPRGEYIAITLPHLWEWYEWRGLANTFGRGVWVIMRDRQDIAKKVSGVDLFRDMILQDYKQGLLTYFSTQELLIIQSSYRRSDQHRTVLQRDYQEVLQREMSLIARERNLVSWIVKHVTYDVRKQRPLDRLALAAFEGKELPPGKVRRHNPCVIQ